MKSSIRDTVTQLLAFGLILAVIKLVYLFFDVYHILDFIVFLIAGVLLGGKVPSSKWKFGLLLALPAFAICLFFVINLGFSSIVNGVGTSYAISLIVIPVATLIGIYIHTKIALRRRGVQK